MQEEVESSIPIEKTDLKGFEQVARKYGVDYAIAKDQNMVPPKYTVFFKAKDADALTSAFEEFTNRKLKAKEKSSVLEQLNKLKELVAAILPDKVRHKSQKTANAYQLVNTVAFVVYSAYLNAEVLVNEFTCMYHIAFINFCKLACFCHC